MEKLITELSKLVPVWLISALFVVVAIVYLTEKLVVLIMKARDSKPKTESVEKAFNGSAVSCHLHGKQIKDIESNIKENLETSKRILGTLKALKEMHDVIDEDRVPVWYIKKSLLKNISKVCDNTDELKLDVSKLILLLDNVNDEIQRGFSVPRRQGD